MTFEEAAEIDPSAVAFQGVKTGMDFERQEDESYDWLASQPECNYCGGSGTVDDDDNFERECQSCNGLGVIVGESFCDEW